MTARCRTCCSAATPARSWPTSSMPRQSRGTTLRSVRACASTTSTSPSRTSARAWPTSRRRGRLPDRVDPVEAVLELRHRYDELWTELTAPDEVGARRATPDRGTDPPAQRARVRRRRARRSRPPTTAAEHLRIRPVLSRRATTRVSCDAAPALEVQENQARRLLNRHRRLPSVAGADTRSSRPGVGGGSPVAGGGLRATAGPGPARSGRPSRTARAVPRAARAPAGTCRSGPGSRSPTTRRWPTTSPTSCRPAPPSELSSPTSEAFRPARGRRHGARA